MSAKKRNKFYFFIEEIVRDLKQDGLTCVNWGMVNYAAGDSEWARCDEAQRSVYAQMSRENKLKYEPELTPQRRQRLERVRALLQNENDRIVTDRRERQELQRNLERRIRETLDSLPRGEALADTTFFVIDAEYFVAHPFVPCEFAVAEFSVRNGIREVLHFFVDPVDGFPANRSFDEKTRSEQVHGIPFLTRFQDAAFDYKPKKRAADDDDDNVVSARVSDAYRNLFRDHGKLARLLRDFLTAKETAPLPPLFTLDDRHSPEDVRAVSGVERVTQCCDWLFGQTKTAPKVSLEVLPLEQLLFAFHRHSERGSVTPAEPYFNLFVTSGKWDHLSKSRCAFHEEIEMRCSLGSVYKWCYALFDHLKKPEPTLIPIFDFELTPSHLPKMPPFTFVVHTMESLEGYLQEADASVGALSAITDAFAADLFSELNLSDGFRPIEEGRQVQGDPPRPLGLGRGTFLRKPFC